MRFFYHYNKPATQRRGKPTISLHFDGACHLIDHIKITNVAQEDKIRKRQPRFVMVGNANNIQLKRKNGEVTGIIT